MAIYNISTSTDNGIARITTSIQVTGSGSTAGIIDGECVVLDRSASVLETDNAAGRVYITNSQIVFDSDTGTGNDNAALLNFGGRTVATTVMSVVDSNLLAKALSSRHNIQVTELTRSEVIESGSTGQLFVYTGPNAILNTVLFRGINVWEIYSAPSQLYAVSVDDVNYGYLNWEAGRLDFYNFAVTRIRRAHAWFGQGASGVNSSWHWNNDPTFDKRIMYMTDADNRYYEGYTATWKFIDRDTLSAVSDVLLIYRDNRSGSSAEQGRFVTNTDGYLTGTFDSRLDTTGADTVRPTLYVLTAQVTSVDTGSPGAYQYPEWVITGDQGNRSFNYAITTVTPQIEIRSYAHGVLSSYGPSSNFIITKEIGTINSDLTVKIYFEFLLIADDGVTATKTVALAYTTIDNLEQLYDRIKAEWRQNDNYPRPYFSGTVVDTGTYNLTLNSGAASVYTFATNTITVKSAATFAAADKFDTFKVNASTTLTLTSTTMSNNLTVLGTASVPNMSSLTGTVTVTGGTLTFNGYNSAALTGSANYAATLITATSTANGDVWDFRGFTFNAATVLRNTSGYNIIAKLLPGQTQPTKQETSGTITFDTTVATTLTVTGVVQNTQCWIYSGSTELLNSAATTQVSGNSYKATAAYSYSADTTVTVRAREMGYLPYEATATITSAGLTATAVWVVDANWRKTVAGVDISFTAPDTITRASGNFTTDGWLSVMGQVTVSGSALNDGTYTLSAIGTTTVTITGATLTSATATSGITLTFTRIALT